MLTESATMLPSAEYMKQQQAKAYPLPIEPWVAANLSRLWQDMKAHIRVTTTATATASGLANASGTQAQPRNDQSTPASARNHS
jgi:hypothetical protein